MSVLVLGQLPNKEWLIKKEKFKFFWNQRRINFYFTNLPKLFELEEKVRSNLMLITNNIPNHMSVNFF